MPRYLSPLGMDRTLCPVSDAPAGIGRPWPLDKPLDPARALKLAALFKALADPVRLRLLTLIATHQDGEVCVCDLAGAFDLTQPTISHHLKVLRETGLITCQRRATWVYYRPVPHAIAGVVNLISAPEVEDPALVPV